MASVQMESIRAYTQEMTSAALATFSGKIDEKLQRWVVEEAQATMPLQDGVAFIPLTLGGVDAELSKPAFARDDAIILYLHGGGLVCGNAQTSRGYASMLAGESRIPVYSFSYRLAPEDPYPAPLDDCVNAYKEAMELHPDVPIFLIGESGGGLLSITTALRLRDEGIRMPAAIVVYSPVTDFSGSLDYTGYGWDDITITPAGLAGLADCYVPDISKRTEPYASPYFADFTGFCPTYVAWDRGETLARDAEVLVEKLLKANVPVTYHRFDGCFHAFAPLGRNAPEGAELLDESIAFMLQHMHRQRLNYDE